MIPVPMQDMHPSSMKLIHIDSIKTSNSVLYLSPLNGTGHYEASNLITGRNGEKMVYRRLLNEHRDHLKSASIVWQNRDSESYLPYDISLTINDKTQYIEVKSTRTYNQHIFPISINEIEWFLRHKENDFIYRVYTEEKKIVIFNNILWRLSQKQQLACLLKILSISSD